MSLHYLDFESVLRLQQIERPQAARSHIATRLANEKNSMWPNGTGRVGKYLQMQYSERHVEVGCPGRVRHTTEENKAPAFDELVGTNNLYRRR